MSGSKQPVPARARVALLAGALATAAPCAAQPAPATPEPAAVAPARKWYEEVVVRAFVSASYGYGFNGSASRTNQLRAFDAKDRSVRLDVAELVFRKDAENPGEAGFRIDALAGASLPRVTAARGLFRDPETDEAGDFDLLQAYVSWIAPLGSGLRVDAGKFVTSFGLEPIEGPDAFGDHATHSFLFGLGEPTTHTGLKAGYAFSGVLSAELLLVNGWDDVEDRNAARSLGAGLTLAPGRGVTLTASVMRGPERDGNERDDRTLVGLAAELEPGGAVAAGVNVERGVEEGLGPGGGAAAWWGVAAYARWKVSARFGLALRAERFEDTDGSRTGSPTTLHEVTLTPSLTLAQGFVVRADLRLDLADREAFEGRDGLLTRRRQGTVLLNALYVY